MVRAKHWALTKSSVNGTASVSRYTTISLWPFLPLVPGINRTPPFKALLLASPPAWNGRRRKESIQVPSACQQLRHSLSYSLLTQCTSTDVEAEPHRGSLLPPALESRLLGVPKAHCCHHYLLLFTVTWSCALLWIPGVCAPVSLMSSLSS